MPSILTCYKGIATHTLRFPHFSLCSTEHWIVSPHCRVQLAFPGVGCGSSRDFTSTTEPFPMVIGNFLYYGHYRSQWIELALIRKRCASAKALTFSVGNMYILGPVQECNCVTVFSNIIFSNFRPYYRHIFFSSTLYVLFRLFSL